MRGANICSPVCSYDVKHMGSVIKIIIIIVVVVVIII